jgi:hypothetical protein
MLRVVVVMEDLEDAPKEMGVQTHRELTQSQEVFMELWQWMLFLVVPEEVPDKTVPVELVGVRLKLWLLEP